MEKKKENCLINIKRPTKKNLLEKVNSFSKKEIIIYYLISEVNESWFSFICGIVANIPITIFFNLVDFVIEDSYLYFFLYVTSFIVSTVMTCALISFTIQNITINQKVRTETNLEIYDNKMAEEIINSLSTLKRSYDIFIIFSILFVINSFIMFLENNFSISVIFLILFYLLFN